MDINKRQKIEIKSVLWFIILTFALTFGLEFSLIANGLRFTGDINKSSPALWLLVTMWIPGLVALFVTKFVEGATFSELIPALSLRMGRIGPYFIVFLIAPLVFFFIYILTWKLGLSGFDPTMNQLAKQGGAEITPENIKIILALSIFLGPLFNLIFGLGEEIGWRGFLLPRLMPLGKTKAYIILGIIWGLWHSPIIYAGFNYPGYPMGGIAMMCALTIAFGLFLNEMTLHYKSSILAGFIHGAINAQGFGIWAWMFPDANPMLGGGTGLVAVVVWLITGFATVKILMRLRQTQTS